jgi:hypothetical protein
MGGFFHRRVKQAELLRGMYKLHFFPWYAMPEYQRPARSDDEPLSDEDLERMQVHHLSLEQILWYRDKREDMMDGPDDLEGYRLFLQEYPSTIDEAFQSSGGKLFPNTSRTELPDLPKKLPYSIQYKPSVPGHEYFAGIDSSGGVGRDYFVCDIVDATLNEQVFQWRSNLIVPDKAIAMITPYLRMYNEAFVTPEANNHGHVIIRYLRANYPTNRIWRQTKYRSQVGRKTTEYGWVNSQQSKKDMVNYLRAHLRRGFRYYSEASERELQAFEETEEGKLQAPQGETDDCVIGLGLALMGVEKLFAPRRINKMKPVEKHDFSWQKMKDLALQNQRSPVPRGVDLGGVFVSKF